MPPTHTDEGVKAAVQLRKQHPGVGVLAPSQYVEERYATELLAGSSRGVGYLLKDRVAEVREFVDAVVRVAQGGTALDPEVVAVQLLGRSRKQDVLAGLTAGAGGPRTYGREGRTNSAIARQLVVSDGAARETRQQYLPETRAFPERRRSSACSRGPHLSELLRD